MMLFGFSLLLDTGEYDHMSFDDVKDHIHKGDLLDFLNEKSKLTFDMGFSRSEPEFARWYMEKLDDLCNATEGRERRKYGIEKRGLCLLISYTAELIQNRESIRLEYTK
jgi:hypothetical protein